MVRLMLAIWAVLAMAGPAVGQESPIAGPGESLSDFELMEFLAVGRMSPRSVIDLDNNGEILLACRQPCSLGGLRSAGVEVTASQLQLLRVMDLLRRDGSSGWRTGFPILGADKSADLRAESEELAARAFVALRPQIDQLQATLDAGGLQSNAYAVYFSYVLDGMAWGFLEGYKRVPRRGLSASRPFWAGEIWALETPRDDWVGTASIAKGGLALRVLMSRPIEDSVKVLLGRRDLIGKALEEYLAHGQVADLEALELLQTHGMADSKGNLTVPVIGEFARADVFLAARSLTSDLVDWILEELDFPALRAKYELQSEPQALVVVYHELMWSLLSKLEEQGIATRPAVLDRAGDVSLRDIGQLVILLDQTNQGTRDGDAEAAVDSSGQEETP